MIADHLMKANGRWYKAGEEVSESPVDKPSPEKNRYTKTEINKMNVSELRRLAAENGVKDPESINGTDLKSYLISAFGL